MRLKTYILLLLLGFNLSCDLFKEKDDRIPIARVNESYLYQEDISQMLAEGTSKEDSIILVSNFINRWATEQLLV